MHVRYILALLISLSIHGLLFVQWQTKSEQASSKGSAHILLLEDSTHWQTEAPELSAQKSKTSSIVTAQSKQQQIAQEQAKPNRVRSKKRSAQSTRTGQDQNLAGKALSAEQTYRNSVVQHLLNTMEKAPTLGSVSVKIWLMPSGIAYKIETNNESGDRNYEQWVKSKVLAANPYPPIPKEVSAGNLELSFKVQHQNDEE